MSTDQVPNKEVTSKKSRPKKKKATAAADEEADEWAAIMAQAPIKKEKSIVQTPTAENAGVGGAKKKRNRKKKTEATPEDEAAAAPTVSDEPTATSTAGESGTSAKKKKKQAATTQPAAPVKKKNLAMLARMKETLERQRLEEERKKQEEEAIRKALEEAEAQEAEAARMELELREKRKQEKKERLQRLKEEGKPVTKSEKENHARFGMMMEALKSQGIEIPQKALESKEKKPVVYGKMKKKSSKNNKNNNQPPNANATDTDVKVAHGEISLATRSADTNIVNGEFAESHVTSLPNDAHRLQVPVQEERTRTDSDSVPDDWEAAVDAELNKNSNNNAGAVNTNKSTKNDSHTATFLKSDDPTAVLEQSNGVSVGGAKKKRLRSPVVCVLGHVDTGKTKILDKLRLTNVQAGEAGGITQQIGVTNVHKEHITENLQKLSYMHDFRFLIPGFLIIDTPGHESFRNLRSRGSSLCDIAILVVDIMHGMEAQTLESFKLLKEKKAPYVIALNKVDRLYNWKSASNLSVTEALSKQQQHTQDEFRERFNQVIAQFATEGVNLGLFNEVDDYRNIVPVVPTSAHSGDGISDLIATLCKYSQAHLRKRLTRNESLNQLIVLEVKSVVGFGMVVDAILINGVLCEGDTIVLSGTLGPIVTQIKAILTSQPMTDLRASKTNFTKHASVDESQGIRISASGELENVIAGTPIHVVSAEKPLDECVNEATHYVESILSTYQTEEIGVYVQASTLGSLEALMDFLKTSKISVAGVNIGPVHKKDVLRASVMHQKKSMYAVILAFDVKVESEAILYAKKENVKIFTADIIYHLFDSFTQYNQKCIEAIKEEHRGLAVFPCKLRVLPQFIFNERDPIVMGVAVEAGSLRVGTPLCVPSRDFVCLGTVATIEINKKPIAKAATGQEVAIKIVPASGDTPKMYGRHFDHKDILVSKVTRDSIDIQKTYFRDEMVNSDWALIIKLKKELNIL